MEVMWLNSLERLPVITDFTMPIGRELERMYLYNLEIKVRHIYTTKFKRNVYRFYLNTLDMSNLCKFLEEVSDEFGPPLEVKRLDNLGHYIVSWDSNFIGKPHSIYERRIPKNDLDIIFKKLDLNLLEQKEVCEFLAECEIQNKRNLEILPVAYVNIFLSPEVRHRIHNAAVQIRDIYNQHFT